MSVSDGELVNRIAKKHSVSPAAVEVVLTALRNGGGRMAQFSHADFGGMSQWSPGMSMVGDMFNIQLKAKLDALCSDITAHLDSSEKAGGGRAANVHCALNRAPGFQLNDQIGAGQCRNRRTPTLVHCQDGCRPNHCFEGKCTSGVCPGLVHWMAGVDELGWWLEVETKRIAGES